LEGAVHPLDFMLYQQSLLLPAETAFRTHHKTIERFLSDSAQFLGLDRDGKVPMMPHHNMTFVYKYQGPNEEKP
jgi:hypothetical protein